MYRLTWRFFVAVAGAAGLWGSVHALTTGGVVTLFIITTFVAFCMGLTSTEESVERTWGQAAWLGIAWAAAVVATVGLLSWVGIFGLGVVILLGVLSPRALAAAKRYRYNRIGQAEPTAPAWASSDDLATAGPDHCTGPEARVAPVTEESLLRAPWLEHPLQSMDNSMLCLAWRTSFVALQRPLDEPSRMRIVERRQQVLDEIERRNPDGFSAWMVSGARAGGDPSRYISQQGRRTDRGQPKT